MREVTERKEANWVCCKVKCDRQWYGVGREKCKVKPEHGLMKLESVTAVVGGFIKTVQEQNCDDITAYRLSHSSQDANTNRLAAELKDQYCNCGDEKKQRIALSYATRDNCGSA